VLAGDVPKSKNKRYNTGAAFLLWIIQDVDYLSDDIIKNRIF
jgi:hypothetical protein